MKLYTPGLTIGFEQLNYMPLVGYTLVRITDLVSRSEIQVVICPSQNPKDKIGKQLKALGWDAGSYGLSIEHQYLTKSQALVLMSVSKFNLKAGQKRKSLMMGRYPRNPFVAACAEGILDLELYWTTCLELAWRRYGIFYDRYGTTIKAPTPCNSNPKFNPQRNAEVAAKYEEFCKPFRYYIDRWEKARSAAPCQFSNKCDDLYINSREVIDEEYERVQEEYLFLYLLDLYKVKDRREECYSTQEYYFKVLNSRQHNPFCSIRS